MILLWALTACAPVATPAEAPAAVVTTVAEEAPVTETAPVTNTEMLTDTTPTTDTSVMTDTASLPAEMLGVIWQWQNSEAAAPSRYTLEFMADGNVAVQADCNRGRGTYQIVGQAFFIEVLALTRAACGPDSLDQRFLEQINSTDTYQLVDGTLILTLRVEPGMMTLLPATASAAADNTADDSTQTDFSAEEAQLASRTGRYPCGRRNRCARC
jgi:heat shock protein HslJ